MSLTNLQAQEKGNSAPSYISVSVATPALAEIQTPIYTKADLLRILKIFLEIKGQELKPEVSRERLLEAKVPAVFYQKSHIDCYHFC